MKDADAIVVGSGPNGLSAAVAIAQAGRKVLVLESANAIGGGCRSEELTLPGFVHDVCSAVYPLAIGSPFFRMLPLAAHGLEWIEPPLMLAHPFDDRSAAVVHRSLEQTADGLGVDATSYRRLMGPLIDTWTLVEDSVLGPLRWPRHPLALARFGVQALQSADALARRVFKGNTARGLFAGLAAHSMLPLDSRPTGGVALVLNLMAHLAGWVVPRGGAQTLSNALAAHLRSLGGEIVTGVTVPSIDALPPTRAVLCDLSPKPFLRIAGHRFPPRYRRALEARFRGGMRAARAPARCISAEHSMKSMRRSATPGLAAMPSVPSCCSFNRRRSIHRAHRRAGTLHGHTVTFPTARTLTCCRASSDRSNASRPAFAIGCSPGQS